MLKPEEITEIDHELPLFPQKSAACIEALKIVQKHRGWVSDEAIQDIAQYLEMSADELDSVATFYNMIYRKPVGRHVIHVCDSVSCWIMGYDAIRDALKQKLGVDYGETTKDGNVHAAAHLLPGNVRPCAGDVRRRGSAPRSRPRRASTPFWRSTRDPASAETHPLTANIRDGEAPPDFKAYARAGGYEAVKKAVGKMEPTALTQMVKDANLRGRGGAGFNTGVKWSFVPMGKDVARPKYLVANADEMEPGTFKDRLLMEGDPHLFIEGMILSAWAIQADIGFIFLRWGYPLAEARMKKAIAEAYEAGMLGKNVNGSGWGFELHISRVSAGRYMCGEETGLINALEGKRANPRAKPPFPQVSGLFGKPTIVQNVETLCNVPPIVRHGIEWYKGISKGADGGTKLYGVSGKVKRPGLWELPMGTTVREILEVHAGGMREGLTMRGLLPGGASTAFLLPEHLDVKMDFDSVGKVGQPHGHRHHDHPRRPDQRRSG